MTSPSLKAVRKTEPNLPLANLYKSELLWAPYRAMSKLMLHTHHNTAAWISINRKLADELREIARREQDFVMDFAEKMLTRGTESPVAESGNRMAPEAMEHLYETAIEGVREFGQAFAAAQIRSLEALRDQSRYANGSDAHHGETRAAA